MYYSEQSLHVRRWRIVTRRISLYIEYPKSSVTHRRSYDSSSWMRKLHGSKLDLGTLTAAAEAGV